MNRDDATLRPQVGVSLLVVREFDGKPHVLLGRRRGSHGEGEWGTPGGHQEFGELYEITALSELKEECGHEIEVTYPRYLCTSNLTEYASAGKHYTDVAFVSHWLTGEAVVAEASKCSGWEWHPIDVLPVPLFASVENMVISYHTGQPYFR